MIQPIAIFGYSFCPNNLLHFLHDSVHPFQQVVSKVFISLRLQPRCSDLLLILKSFADVNSQYGAIGHCRLHLRLCCQKCFVSNQRVNFTEKLQTADCTFLQSYHLTGSLILNF